MKEVLTYLFEKNILSKETAKETMLNIGQGKHSEHEIASFLTVYLMRKISPQELAGFREALLELCIPVDLSGYKTIDVCGTGGDEKHTFNISTLTAFILAGAGIKVVKHGNYAISSSCGSSNILEHFGYKFSNNQDKLRNEIEKVNLCYMHAPLFHPAMKFVAPVRRSLKVKTFFNLLGPMVNPAKPMQQIVGVYNVDVLELFHQVFKEAGIHYYILFSLDGYDEISLTGNFKAVSPDESKIYTPEMMGMKKIKPEELRGGATVEESARIFSAILDAKGTEAQQNVVLANSAFAVKCYFPEKTLEDCIAISRESLLSGKAKKALSKLIALQ
jgi:anthranilate phosphoribosyltransferase